MKSIFSFFIALTYIASVTSLIPSKVKEWSEQRKIEDFVLNELTNEVYVAATFLYHIDDTMVTKSKYESNELTATHVIVSPDINTGFACSMKTGHCFLFNLSTVSEKNKFTGSEYISTSHATFPINDMDILPVTIRDSKSICFVIADERTGGITYRLLIYPSNTYTDTLADIPLPSFTDQFTGTVVPGTTPMRRSLLAYSIDGFVYFISRHVAGTDFPLYVMRMCENETDIPTRIDSLIEVRLHPCDDSKKYPQNVAFGDLNTFYGQVILVTFTTGENGEDSVICVYTQFDIENTIDTTIQSCFAGSALVEYVFDWVIFAGTHATCNLGLPDNDCELCFDSSTCRIYNYTGIPGVELSGYDNTVYGKISAIYPLSFDEADLIFVGNSVGQLFKFQLISYNSMILIENIILSNELDVRFTDMVSSCYNEYLFASRETLLYRVVIDNCDSYATCESCVDTIDPICGYCSLTDSCTRKSACASAELSLRWIKENSTLCLNINSITPPLAQTGEITELILSIQNLPELQTSFTYECVFLSYRTSVNRITMSGVDISLRGPDTSGQVQAYCEVPTLFTISSDFQIIDFSLYSTELTGNFSLQEDGFIFYDCNYHSRCETCTESLAPCYWCLYDNICTHSNTICNLTSVLPSMNSSFCPAITETTELSVHSGDNTIDVLELQTVNAPEPMLGFQYSCVYLYSNGTVTRNASWISPMLIECDPPAMLFGENSDLVSFHLLWGDSSGIYINEYPINVTIFNCERYELSCSNCFGLGGVYGCGNCYKNSNKSGDPICRLSTQCDDTFLNSTQSCPDPKIISFSPLSSHTDGGYNITIMGENFGGSIDDLEVLVANETCRIEDYNFRGRIICLTSISFDGNSGPIIVSVKGINIPSADIFTYLIPVITTVNTIPFPPSDTSSSLHGVIQGGTQLIITGDNLGIGSDRTIYIKDIYPCTIQGAVEPSTIMCITDTSNEGETTGIISIRIDGLEVKYQQDLYRYVTLEVISVNIFSFIPAGGLEIRIQIDDINPLHSPLLQIVNINTGLIANSKSCEDVVLNELICQSPSFSYSSDLIVRFIVDNLQLELTQVALVEDNPTCTDDPVYKGSILIKGVGFSSVNEDEYSITITLSSNQIIECRILTLTDDTLECIPSIQMSGTLRVQIGMAHSCTFPDQVSPDTTFFEQYGYAIVGSSAILLMVVLGAALTLLFCVVIRYYRHKQVQQVENIIYQYTKLESNIAKECKTGFAELQVEIVDFVQAADTNTIPFTDFQTYVVKLLFSKNQSVDFLSLPPTDPLKANDVQKSYQMFRKAMKIFQELFNNKEFLIELIRIFDQNSNIEVGEKSYFASLLMIALHKNLFYATEILKLLIDDLISGSLYTSNRDVKTLFRSTSVCEKLLSHWLALCMYNYLRGLPGEELYNLYSAIKVQINKGPIDAITGEAKYSLNQDNMLRTTFEVKEIEILCYSGDEFESIKLLDCDSIGQAKRKIIDTLNKNMLASEKPDPDKLELIYAKPKDAPISPILIPKQKVDPFDSMVITNPIYTPGEDTMAREVPTLSKVKQPYLLFRDIDRTSGIDVGYRRINSLKHYFDFYHIIYPQNGSLLLVQQSDLRDRFPSLYNNIMKRKSAADTPSKIFHFSIPGTAVSTLERHKVVSEVYFTKLLSTKAILQKFIDGMMNSIFPDRIAQQDCPNAIKHLFDFLDDKAKFYNITDPETIHTWKNNSVVLRFWVNLLKNPHFILDIDMPYPVESSLSIIAQGLIDSCSTRDEELTRDSPANKLLFAKDTKSSRKRVKKYYDDIQSIHQTQSNFNQHLRQMQLSNSPFFVESAIQEIFLKWVSGTSIVGNLMTRLRELKLETQIAKFTQILNMLSDNPTYDDSTIL